MPRALVMLRASRGPNRRVFRRSQILALGTAYLLTYRLGSSLRPSLAFALRNSAALTRPRIPRSSCIIPAGLNGPDQTVLCQLRSGTPSNPSIFSEISLFPLRASASRAAFQGLALHRLMRSAPGTASSISLNQFLCKLFLIFDLAELSTPPLISCQSPEELIHQKAVGPPPLPGRWPSDPYRPVTGLRKCPLRSCPAGCASVIEVSNHRWTFAALLRVRRKA